MQKHKPTSTDLYELLFSMCLWLHNVTFAA